MQEIQSLVMTLKATMRSKRGDSRFTPHTAAPSRDGSPWVVRLASTERVWTQAGRRQRRCTGLHGGQEARCTDAAEPHMGDGGGGAPCTCLCTQTSGRSTCRPEPARSCPVLSTSSSLVPQEPVTAATWGAQPGPCLQPHLPHLCPEPAAWGPSWWHRVWLRVGPRGMGAWGQPPSGAAGIPPRVQGPQQGCRGVLQVA